MTRNAEGIQAMAAPTWYRHRALLPVLAGSLAFAVSPGGFLEHTLFMLKAGGTALGLTMLLGQLEDRPRGGRAAAWVAATAAMALAPELVHAARDLPSVPVVESAYRFGRSVPAHAVYWAPAVLIAGFYALVDKLRAS